MEKSRGLGDEMVVGRGVARAVGEDVVGLRVDRARDPRRGSGQRRCAGEEAERIAPGDEPKAHLERHRPMDPSPGRTLVDPRGDRNERCGCDLRIGIQVVRECAIGDVEMPRRIPETAHSPFDLGLSIVHPRPVDERKRAAGLRIAVPVAGRCRGGIDLRERRQGSEHLAERAPTGGLGGQERKRAGSEEDRIPDSRIGDGCGVSRGREAAGHASRTGAKRGPHPPGHLGAGHGARPGSRPAQAANAAKEQHGEESLHRCRRKARRAPPRAGAD